MPMRLFQKREVGEAREYAAEGGQALHDSGLWVVPTFGREVACAHLFDQNHDRLVSTALMLGINRVVVQRAATSRQHIDLWGAPLRAALRLAGDGESD